MAIDLLPEVSREKPWQPEKWGPQHRMIVALRASGMRPGEIASYLNLSNSHVSVILNDPRAALEITDLAARFAEHATDLHVKMKLLAHEALDEITDEMRHSGDERIRQKSALAILDRAGYTPVQKHLVASAPPIPEELASRIAETHGEMREIASRYRYSRPSELRSPEELDAEILPSTEDEDEDD